MAKKKPPSLPEINHLRFLVIEALGEKTDPPVLGSELRKKVATTHVFETNPGFYQFMAKLVRQGYVVQSRSAGDYRARCYKLTAAGARAHQKTLSFYESFI